VLRFLASSAALLGRFPLGDWMPVIGGRGARRTSTYRCATPGTSGIGRLARGCGRDGSWLVRWWMAIGPPSLVLVVTRQGAATRRKVPADVALGLSDTGFCQSGARNSARADNHRKRWNVLRLRLLILSRPAYHAGPGATGRECEEQMTGSTAAGDPLWVRHPER
jgi:hypothetical protein